MGSIYNVYNSGYSYHHLNTETRTVMRKQNWSKGELKKNHTPLSGQPRFITFQQIL